MKTLINGVEAFWSQEIMAMWMALSHKWHPVSEAVGRPILWADRVTRKRDGTKRVEGRQLPTTVITESFTYAVEGGDQFVLVLDQREEIR
jgi:hypothetical protein